MMKIVSATFFSRRRFNGICGMLLLPILPCAIMIRFQEIAWNRGFKNVRPLSFREHPQMAKNSPNGPWDSFGDPRKRNPSIRSNLAFLLMFGLLIATYIFKSHDNSTHERADTDVFPHRQVDSNDVRPRDQNTENDDRSSRSVAKKSQAEVTNAPEDNTGKPSPDSYHLRDVTLRDQNGRVIYQGDVDLEPTLKRIADGKRLSFPNDGSVFQNREGRLPKKAAGYYQEWVHPTPKNSGPGPQRIVTGKNGEVFYTHDHYRTFLRIQ